jgi:hypothetical protein
VTFRRALFLPRQIIDERKIFDSKTAASPRIERHFS